MVAVADFSTLACQCLLAAFLVVPGKAQTCICIVLLLADMMEP
jgi:hypothetical protein